MSVRWLLRRGFSLFSTLSIRPKQRSRSLAVVNRKRMNAHTDTLSLSLSVLLHRQSNSLQVVFLLKRRVSYSYPRFLYNNKRKDIMLIPKKNRKDVYKHLFKGEC